MFTVSCQLTVRRALPRPPNKLFFYLQVSQSGYANLINGHASLLSPRGGGGGGGGFRKKTKTIRFRRILANRIIITVFYSI